MRLVNAKINFISADSTTDIILSLLLRQVLHNNELCQWNHSIFCLVCYDKISILVACGDKLVYGGHVFIEPLKHTLIANNDAL